MSTNHHPETTTHHEEHGTVPSYIIGFILSLVFTIIPYYMVVKHVVSGMGLLSTILGFAVLQMIIQIVFFLHIGREKKPYWQLMFFISTIGIILVVVVGSLWIIHHLHYNMTPVTPADASKKLVEGEGIYQIGGQKTGACKGKHPNHKVTIANGRVSPRHTEARVCDTLSFINEDNVAREITFSGQARVYVGDFELTVHKGRAKTITLSEAGTYQFRDTAGGKVAGDFTVTRD